MEKIIYVYATGEKENKTQIWGRLQDMLGLAYPVTERRAVFLGFPVTAYVVAELRAADIIRLERNGDGDSQRRLRRTLKKIDSRVQRSRRENTAVRAEDIVFFRQWEDFIFPSELLIRFYQDCQKENIFVFRAQQLIFLDGWEMPEELVGSIEWDRTGEEELALMREIYTTYNYVTIVTEREEAWQEFVETAYEEYGLSVRCTEDSKNLSFRDKPTLIMDLCREDRRCSRNFPKSSVYMDLRDSPDKARRISVKCRGIPYISLRNALDTVLKDTL